MVWYFMVWYGMVWYGIKWYGIKWYGIIWYSMVGYGTVRETGRQGKTLSMPGWLCKPGSNHDVRISFSGWQGNRDTANLKAQLPLLLLQGVRWTRGWHVHFYLQPKRLFFILSLELDTVPTFHVSFIYGVVYHHDGGVYQHNGGVYRHNLATFNGTDTSLA